MFSLHVEAKAKQLMVLPADVARAEFGRIVALTFEYEKEGEKEKFIYGLTCNAHLVTKLRELGHYDRIWETSR